MVNRLDDREVKVSLYAAALAAATFVALWVALDFTRPATILGAVGLVLAGLLAMAARSRSRILTGVAAVVLGYGPWGRAFILGLPYVALAAWLFFRGARARAERKYGARRTVEAGSKDVARQPRKEPVSRSSPPRPNKRYTPPQRRS